MLHLELLPDAGLERALRADWERLEAAGLPNLSRHPSASNQPHVTLLIDPEPGEDVDRVAERLAPLRERLPLPVRAAAVSLFPARGRSWVLVRTLVVDEALLALHTEALRLLGVAVVPHCEPGRWVPHTTLSRRLGAAEVAGALGVLADVEAPSGELVGLRLWDARERRLAAVGPG